VQFPYSLETTRTALSNLSCKISQKSFGFVTIDLGSFLLSKFSKGKNLIIIIQFWARTIFNFHPVVLTKSKWLITGSTIESRDALNYLSFNLWIKVINHHGLALQDTLFDIIKLLTLTFNMFWLDKLECVFFSICNFKALWVHLTIVKAKWRSFEMNYR